MKRFLNFTIICLQCDRVIAVKCTRIQVNASSITLKTKYKKTTMFV